jgi:membrane protease YdiL (CAAX protease family)
MPSNSAKPGPLRGDPRPAGQKEQLWEVAVFLFLVVPSMVLSFFVIRQGNLGFVFTACSVILRDLALVSLIFFFLWRNGEPVASVGWNHKNGWKDVVLGIGLFLPMSLGAGLLDHALQAAGLSPPATPLPKFLEAKGQAEFLLAFFLVVIVAIAEETIFRGYLLRRFRDIHVSRPGAVVLSALIFSLGHGYEGTSGVITVGAMGLMLAVIYLWRQSLVAPMVMHFLQDFIGIVLAPWLGLK